MKQRKKNFPALGLFVGFPFFLLSLAGCATFHSTNISDVPKINLAHIKTSPLNNIPQNTVNLSVLDNRDPQYRKDTEALQAELRRAITQSFKSQGIMVNPKSPNNLLISVQDEAAGEYKDSCVKVNGLLALKQIANIYSDATSCFAIKSPVSTVLMSGDINQAYEMALTTVFKNFSTNLQKLSSVKK